ncbi:filaggrin-2 isoform X8 [Oryctolagus cuniculus]|uniref:filaggrin-2 isoform X8 n=1 Tax=Oryctolagus cuniculus TaxID=9986 RepID=UPI003878FB29
MGQVSPLALASMGLTQVSPLALDSTGLDPQVRGHKERHNSSQEIPLDLSSLVVGSPRTLCPTQPEEEDQSTLSPVRGRSILESHTDTQDPIKAKQDLNRESLDPQVRGHKERRNGSQEIPLDLSSLVVGSPRTLCPTQPEEEDQSTLSPVRMRSILESHTDTQDPIKAKQDLNRESLDPQVRGHKERRNGSQEIPLDLSSLVVGNPRTLCPTQPEEEDQSTLSPVRVRSILESHTDTQDPIKAKQDLNRESLDPQVRGHKERRNGSQEIPLDLSSLVVGNPRTLCPTQPEEEDQATLSPVRVRSILESHTDTQDPIKAKQDLNRESLDPQVRGHKERHNGSQEIPLDLSSLVVGSPRTLCPTQPEEEDQSTLSPVRGRSILESHTDTQDPIKAKQDLNRESLDPQVRGHKERHNGSQEIPLDLSSLVVGNPRTLCPTQPEEEDQSTLSPVRMRSILESHTDTQDPIKAKQDLNRESLDPQVRGHKERHNGSQEIPLDLSSLVVGNPRTLCPTQPEEEDQSTLSPVRMRSILESHTDTQDPIKAKQDLNRESLDPQVRGHKERRNGSQEIPLDLSSLVVGNPRTLCPTQPEEEDQSTLSPVRVRSILESHTDTQDPIKAKQDLNRESLDPQVRGHKERRNGSQEIPLDLSSLVVGNPRTLCPTQPEEEDQSTLSPVRVRSILESHTDTQDPIKAKQDLNRESLDPQVRGHKERHNGSQEIPLDLSSLVVGNPRTLCPTQPEEED